MRLVLYYDDKPEEKVAEWDVIDLGEKQHASFNVTKRKHCKALLKEIRLAISVGEHVMKVPGASERLTRLLEDECL